MSDRERKMVAERWVGLASYSPSCAFKVQVGFADACQAQGSSR
jgi:hypothetical protein